MIRGQDSHEWRTHGNALRLSPFSSTEVIILWPKKKNLYTLLRQAAGIVHFLVWCCVLILFHPMYCALADIATPIHVCAKYAYVSFFKSESVKDWGSKKHWQWDRKTTRSQLLSLPDASGGEWKWSRLETTTLEGGFKKLGQHRRRFRHNIDAVLRSMQLHDCTTKKC